MTNLVKEQLQTVQHIITVMTITGIRESMKRKVKRLRNDLKRKVGKVWRIYRHLEVIPVAVGALGEVSKRLDVRFEKLGINNRKGLLQKAALLRTARVPRKTLES